MASLNDVSRDTGFSVRTVSRALQGVGYVGEATREAVLASARRLGYRPNLKARALKTGRSFEVAVLLGSMDEIQMERISAFEKILRGEGYAVHIFFVPQGKAKQEEIADIVNSVLDHRPAGIVIFSSALEKAAVPMLEEAGLPHVLVDTRNVEKEGIRIDRQQGVYEAVKYLAGKGCKRIAYMGNPVEHSRTDGYERAIRELGQAPVMIVPPEGESQHAQGMACAESFLGMSPRPDAVQAYSDIMAMGFLAGLHARGVRVPEDVAIIGFDNRNVAALAWPALTTVAQPNQEAGEAAARILLEKMGKPSGEENWRPVLPTRLVIRESA